MLGSASLLLSQKLETFKCKLGDDVNCPECRTKNSADAVFCENCGSRLEVACTYRVSKSLPGRKLRWGKPSPHDVDVVSRRVGSDQAKFVEIALRDELSVRDARWSEAVAVGNLNFVEKMKSEKRGLCIAN